MLNYGDIVIIILIIVGLAFIIGLSMATAIDKKLSDITITIPKIEIPETKVMLRSEDLSRFCALAPATMLKEQFSSLEIGPALAKRVENDTEYITAEKYYQRYYYGDKKALKHEEIKSKLIGANYAHQPDAAPVKDFSKIITGALNSNDVSKIKPANYVFRLK